jgi:hypothetical protein
VLNAVNTAPTVTSLRPEELVKLRTLLRSVDGPAVAQPSAPAGTATQPAASQPATTVKSTAEIVKVAGDQFCADIYNFCLNLIPPFNYRDCLGKFAGIVASCEHAPDNEQVTLPPDGYEKTTCGEYKKRRAQCLAQADEHSKQVAICERVKQACESGHTVPIP